MEVDTWEIAALRSIGLIMSQAATAADDRMLFDRIVESAAEVAAFQVAALSLVLPNGDLEAVAVGGDARARDAVLGRVTPRHVVDAEFAAAEQWGALRFVPHDRLPGSSPVGWSDPTWSGGDSNVDPWHPNDTLFAPFFTASGDLAGTLNVDLPLNGQRPGPLQRVVLEVFAGQAGVVLAAAQERTRLAERVRLTQAVQAVARVSNEVLEPEVVVAAVAEPVAKGLGCSQLWIRTFGDDIRDDHFATYPHPATPTPPELVEVARRVAHDAWGLRRTVTVAPTGASAGDLVTAAEEAAIIDFVSSSASHSLLLVPIGAASQCLGYVVCTRAGSYPTWSDAERAAALEIGRDLGRSVLNSRLFALERKLVSNLRVAERARATLFSTVSHELKNPLASVVGHVEMLQDDPEGDSAWSLGVIDRNVRRLQGLVDDLLDLGRFSDPDRPLVRTSVDVNELVRDALEMFAPEATKNGVTLQHEQPVDVAVSGSSEELSRVVTNLVGNAVKFSRRGGRVGVRVDRSDHHLVLEVTDQGLGMSQEDQARLFTEFFRSTNPDALAVPGTGLGLSIVKHIVVRHGGSIDVTSGLGEGTTFTVRLPAV
ncbi:HAMP domain-containing sensor histidine kinase [Phycicoccus sp. Soil803]|uniref:sensor histidine kinase n=1 Tax=Phycicoccus sp. Soil803 TaxID=1736415 RepID=UPI0009E8489C|nr:HAMP domain-containing sensor histidine kinase [Phycicoccus sp. Soil803]